MPRKKVLVVEDEELLRSILRRLLEGEGYEVLTADSAEAALRIFGEKGVDLTLSDIKMAGMDGIELLSSIRAVDETAPVIMMTAFSSVDTAVAALRHGAYDYITKPFINEDLLQRVKNALEHRTLVRENRALRSELGRRYSYDDIIGRSTGLKEAFDIVEKIADTSTTVVISGESGTGKELIARSLHFNSTRSALPFLAINCGALPESLLESELFGHTKGAFTGAVGGKKGYFRSVDGGTLFLDEIGEMPLALQVKLLRALQEREVTPVGSSRAESFDARIVSATNRDLEAEVAAGNFREDLFYRLNVVEIRIPPLRERRADIPLLAKHFVGGIARELNTPAKEIDPEAVSELSSYDWPGNVRELENTIERAFVLSGEAITVDDLPEKITSRGGSSPHAKEKPDSLEERERAYVYEVLESVSNDKVEAAKILGIDLSTLYRKLKRYEEI
jgi:DNA-binding NtrC family response regulator